MRGAVISPRRRGAYTPAMTRIPASDDGTFLWMTYRAMLDAGLDCAAIFASVGLPDQVPDRRPRRVNGPQRQFWDAAVRVSGDPHIGLHIGERMPPWPGQVLEYLLLSSPTLGEGLERVLAYQRLITDALPLRLAVHGDEARLAGLDHPVRHYLECATCIALRFLERVTDGEFQATAVRFPHAEGAPPAEYRRVLGCGVTLGAEEGAIVFPAALLARPSPAAEPALLAVHEQLAAERMAALGRREFLAELERHLGGLLERGEASLEALAARAGLTPRALRAALADAGTGFKPLLAGYRERLSRRLLARTDAPIDRILYLTGFSEPAAFSRAFKRWTGETPTAYRRRKHAGRALDPGDGASRGGDQND